MPHPLETMIRDAYACFGRGDVDGYLSACTSDFVLHVPSGSGISGDYIGQAGLHELAGKAMEITGGTFHEEVEDVLVNDRHAVVLARHSFTRGGSAADYQTAHVYEVNGNKLSC